MTNIYTPTVNQYLMSFLAMSFGANAPGHIVSTLVAHSAQMEFGITT